MPANHFLSTCGVQKVRQEVLNMKVRASTPRRTAAAAAQALLRGMMRNVRCCRVQR